MKITKLPKECNPSTIIENEVRKQNMFCPYCGENRRTFVQMVDGTLKEFGIREHIPTRRYGKQKPLWKHIFSKYQYWKILHFKCNTCGCEWDSDEFPEIEMEDMKWR